MSCFTRFQYTDTYALAARVKTKLTDEAVRANVNLRRLVCQANLLDTLINSLNTPSNNVSFESINNNLFYTSDDSDFDDSDNSDDDNDDSESDLESDLSVDDNDFVNTNSDEHFNYLSDALQRLNMSSHGYVENVEEILSSDSESETEQQFDIVNFEDDDDDDYEGLSLSKMASNASHMYQHHNNDDQYFHDDNDTLHENSSSEDLPSLSNCSSISSLEECPLMKASEYQLHDIKNTNTTTHSSYPLLNYS